MGRQGPCYHCGVTSTPLWRNGPPEKPVLCNACGSRWRTKGTLANYVPLHARFDPDDYEDLRMGRVKTISLKKKDEKLAKRKLNYDNTVDDDGFTDDYSHSFLKNIDDNTSNRSSSGSAISNSESCAQFSSADASDLTGPASSIVWDTLVPSKKRTCVIRQKQSSVEKLTKDLCSILHEQASHFSSSSDDLLFESETPMVSVEIGHGSVLIRHPSSLGRELESEASSLSVDSKHSLVNTGHPTTPVSRLSVCDSGIMSGSHLGKGKFKKPNGGMMHMEQAKRDNGKHEKSHPLWTRNSPLCHVDLTEIVNLDTFQTHLTASEQQQLFKYLPSVDTSVFPESLRSMFSAPLFKGDLPSFQKLLSEGLLDTSETNDCEILKRLALSDLAKCKWVEHYSLLKDKRAKQRTRECSSSMSEPKSSFSSNLINAKKPKDIHRTPETKFTLKTPKRPGNLFATKINGSSFMVNHFQFEGESSDQDLLLDVPSNGLFPEAELLLRPSSSSSSIHPTYIYP